MNDYEGIAELSVHEHTKQALLRVRHKLYKKMWCTGAQGGTLRAVLSRLR